MGAPDWLVLHAEEGHAAGAQVQDQMLWADAQVGGYRGFHTYSRIGRALGEAGHAPRRGKKWHVQVVKRMVG